MSDPRYKFQSRFVKAYRWLRWRPYFALQAYLAVAWWFVCGAHIPSVMRRYLPTRRAFAGHILAMFHAHAAVKMRDYSTTSEILEELRGRPVVQSERAGRE
jgi:hypothetical protein